MYFGIAENNAGLMYKVFEEIVTENLLNIVFTARQHSLLCRALY